MIECINQVLELIINTAVVFGIGVLVYLYAKIRMIDSKIEKIQSKFEKERDGLRGQGRAIVLEHINGQIEKLERKKNESIAPLERDRQRIFSKIPFIR